VRLEIWKLSKVICITPKKREVKLVMFYFMLKEFCMWYLD